MATVDSLDIQIQGSAQTASNALDDLVGKLEIVATKLTAIGNNKSLADLGRINFKDSGITNLVNSLNRLQKVNNTNFDTSKLDKMASGISKIAGIEDVSLSTNRFVSSIARLASAGDKIGVVSAQLPAFGKALRDVTNGISGVANVSDGVNIFTQSIAALASTGEKAGKTTGNLGALANGLKNLFQVMSTAPQVSQNTIQMTQALAQLASQGNKVGAASNSVVNGLNKTSSAMNRTKKSAFSLAAAFGKFYATYFLLIRGAKKLWGSIQSSFDYLEVLNYFDAAFGQVAANADLSSFEEMGYSSADAYYGSFAKRAEEVTRKMSGFTIGENGLLQSTGAVSLGLDPSKLMNYQAMFGQMSSSMGVASETALKLSQALTEIGADLASVKNMEFEDVWRDMASGLAGMSRTLDKYGVNIRNVNLQQKLMELGIDANIQALNQDDKALLRSIILLENTKYAWGDLADTINQPANQLRLIQANFENLSRTIGNLFLPIVKTVLPYVNALVIAVQRLFAWLGNLIGIDISGISTAIGGADMGDILDQTDDLASGLGDAKKQADKLNKSLRQFDELKVINTKQDDGGAGTGAGIQGGLLDAAFEDAFSKYQQEWDKAFGRLENRAQEIADKIEKAFDPLKKIIQDFAIGDFFQAGQDTSALVAGIFNFFADAIDKVDWYGIGQKIGDFFAGLDWPTIFKAAGNLIWQGLKAAFELYVGAFSSAPLETALVSLVAFPKLLKAITASKIITGVGKLWKNFKVWGEKISLVGALLTGNKDSVSDLITAYPKLSKKVDSVKTAFSKFFSSVKTNGFWKTVDGGITNIRNNLGGLQKAAIVAVAGFAEFSVVSDSVEKLTLGTENWLAEIGKIAGVVAAAGAAMYVALGPAGLAVTAIVGVVGAIKGINDAFDTIRAQEIGESIKNAMSNPGGVPLSEVTAQFSDAIGKIGESFTVITEKAAGLEQADSHIRDTWMEIEKIETAMDTGVMSVEEGTAELTRLFGELSQTASDKFGQLEDTLLVAFGENGVLNEVFERLGISTDNTTSTIIQLNDKVEKRIEELTKLLAETDPTNPQYATYKEELAGLMAQTDELTQAISNYDAALQSIDYSDLILPDGTLDTTALQNFLDELKTATETANTDIENAINTTRQSLEQEKNLAESLGDWVAAEEIQEKLDALPKAMELLQGDVSLKAVALTDTVQNDFIGRMNSIIEGAKTEWGEKGFWGQIWNGVFGAGTEGEFVKEAVDKQVENIGELSKAIETELGDLKVDGIAWGNEAIGAIYDSLFDTEYRFSDMGGGKTVYSLNEDFKSLINGATEGISELTKERGKEFGYNTVEGYSEEMENNSSAENAVKSWMDRIYDAIHDSIMKFGSPSKTAEQFGKYTIEGYNIGVESNAESTLNIITKYTTNIFDKFSEIIAPLNQIGIDAMQGLLNGLSSMESSIYAKADEIANNVANTVKKALDIHSPSKVMFALGDYTMQGFKEGMENLYNPITDSIKSFSYDVAVAPAPSLADMYSGYQYQAAYTPQYGITEYPQSGYGQSDPELKSLLRRNNELLAAILAKPNIEKGEIYNATKELYQRDSIRRYGNPSAYDPILGS